MADIKRNTKKEINDGPFKVFFITSHQSSLDKKLEYTLTKTGMINLKKVYSKTDKFRGEDFSISVFSFEIENKNLRKNDYDDKKKKYKAVIKLKQKKSSTFAFEHKFEGNILFNEKKNNFTFDFKFEDEIGYTGVTLPPPSIKFLEIDQLKIYNQYFKKNKIMQDNRLVSDLIMDCQVLLRGKEYYNIDFFLEIFRGCYNEKPVKTLLMSFNLKKVKIPTYKIEPKGYSIILKTIENNKQKITKHCSEKDSPEKYYKLFFSLLLYFRFHFEKDKIEELLSRKELWNYYKEILPTNYKIFDGLSLPQELINEMLNQEKLSLPIIEGILFYLKILEKILICINENIDLIYGVCIKEKNNIKLNDLTSPKQEDDFEKILIEIDKLINYEIKKGKFILFEEEFFNNYTHYFFKKDLKKLLLLKKIIILCKKVDKDLDPDYNGQIHDTALEMIQKGKLKNEELLDFIEKDDIYFIENKRDFQNLNYRPLVIFEGFDLENVNEQFYEKWNKVNLFKKFSFSNNYYAEKAMIDKISHMKDFGKLLKLFNFDNEKLCDKNTIGLISTKYKKLIKTYTSDTCPNFLKETSLLIYMIDKKTSTGKYFMENTIEKDIKSQELINDIFLYLSSNYKDISFNIIEHITNYFIGNLQNQKNVLKGENLLFLLKKLNSGSIFKAILNKIGNYVIKEEEIFIDQKEVDSFKLLEGIQKEKFFEKYGLLNETSYLLSILTLGDKISNNIKKGEIKYNIVSPWYINAERKQLLIERLKILFFQNEKEVKECMEAIKKYFIKITQASTYIKKLNDVLKQFFIIKNAKEIKFLEDFDREIKGGNLNILEKEEIKEKYDKIHTFVPDLDKKKSLKESIFFSNFFKTLRDNEPLKNEDDIFKETENDFEKLKLLFNNDWITTIDERIIKEIYRSIKEIDEKAIEKELNFLKKFFKLENINVLEIAKVKDQIIIFSKKEEIFNAVNSCLYFISELEATKTDFSTKLSQLRDDISQNITVDKIREYGESLEKYGINILQPKKEDKDYLTILNSLYNKKNALQFIVKLTADDCRHLQEVVSESDNTFLTGAEIHDMEKCSNFMNKVLGDKKVKKTDIDLISSFINEVPKEKNIVVFFTQYANNSGQIQELFSQKLDGSQAALKKIKNILNNSSFTLSIENNNESYFKFVGNFTNEEKQNQPIEYDELIELRGRAMLTKKLGKGNSKEEQQIFELNKKFAERVNEIEKIDGILKKIAEKGYSENINIFIDIHNLEPNFSSDFNKFKEYEDCNKHFNKILSDITETQNNYYKKEETQLIRYVYGRQFNLLNGHLQNISSKSISPFLKYFTNDIIEESESQNEIDFKYDYDLGKGNKYICSLDNINNFLKQYLNICGITIENIYQQNMIKEKYQQFMGLYTYLLEDDKIGEVQKGVEEHILNWYHFLTDHPPMAQTLLLCNEETTSEEITAFMHRAFLCQYHVLFMVGKIELLNPDKRQTLTGLINELYISNENEIKSCVAFAYSDKTSTIVQYLERIKGKQKLEHKDKKKGEEILYDENVEIISSDKSGVGKSTYIKENIKDSNKNYIHFPFGGEFNRKDVINRLKKINDLIYNHKKAAQSIVHLDLYDSKQVDLMKDFLYSFLITKLYGQNENLFYLSKDIEIKIEIPNGFVNFFLKFPILSMFKKRHFMSINNYLL